MAGLAGSDGHFVCVGWNTPQSSQHGIECRGALKIVIRNEQRSRIPHPANGRLRFFRRFNLQIERRRAIPGRALQNLYLLVNAALEIPRVLLVPARRQNETVRVISPEATHHLDAARRVRQIIQPEFQKFAAVFKFPFRRSTQLFGRLEAQRHANTRKRFGERSHSCR